MIQRKLPLPRGPKTLMSVAASHAENNLHAAREILAHVDDYGGPDGGMAAWAREIIGKLNPQPASQVPVKQAD